MNYFLRRVKVFVTFKPTYYTVPTWGVDPHLGTPVNQTYNLSWVVRENLNRESPHWHKTNTQTP